MPSATADGWGPCAYVAPCAFSSTSDVGCNVTVTAEGSLLLTLPPTLISEVGPPAPSAPPPPDPFSPPLAPPLLLAPPFAPLSSDSALSAAAAAAFLAALP